jgi:hypothetical protein
VLDLVLTKHEDVVIVPTTIGEPKHYEETVDRLRGRGHDVRYFALLADRRTVLRRLRERGLRNIRREDRR